MTTSAQIRSQLIQALTMDLVGPTPKILDHLELEGRAGEAAEIREEVLDRPPNRWYQIGFLIPSETNLGERADDAADDEFAGLDGQNLSAKRKSNASGDDTGASEAGPARRVFFPCSVGVSLLIPAATGLEVTVHWASYKPTAPPEGSKADEAWLREPHTEQISIPAEWLAPRGRSAQAKPVPGSEGLMLRWHLRPAPVAQGYPPGAVAVSLFLTNERRFEGRSAEDRDRASAYQVQLDVICGAGFLERRDPRAADLAINANDWDHRVNNLHYRGDHEFAVGHNISVAPRLEANGRCLQISTTWLPQATVERVLPRVGELEAAGLVLSMPELDRLASEGADPVQTALRPLVTAYTDWIEQQRTTTDTASTQQQATAAELLHEASKQARRIERGIEALENEQVRLAFAIANRVMAAAARQRFGVMRNQNPDAVKPQWRPFQLAFVLMNLVGMAEPTDGDRDTIDLLFFPTGGGKTEAYLGLAATTLVLRRLRHGGSIASAGMSVSFPP